MSSSRQSWRPWQLEELSRPRQTVHRDSGESDAGEQELARLRADAWQTAYEEGLQQGRKEGYEAGFALGQKEGKAEGLARAEQQAQQALDEELQPLGQLILQANSAFCQMNKEVANEVVDLAVAVGRFLARSALDTKPEEILGLVRELLNDEQGLASKPRLFLNSADLLLVREHLATEISAAGWQLQVDDSLQRGGCKLITAAGEIDASWEARCQNIADQLRNASRAPAKAATQTHIHQTNNGDA